MERNIVRFCEKDRTSAGFSPIKKSSSGPKTWCAWARSRLEGSGYWSRSKLCSGGSGRWGGNMETGLGWAGLFTQTKRATEANGASKSHLSFYPGSGNSSRRPCRVRTNSHKYISGCACSESESQYVPPLPAWNRSQHRLLSRFFAPPRGIYPTSSRAPRPRLGLSPPQCF